jgi:hypothetical protein
MKEAELHIGLSSYSTRTDSFLIPSKILWQLPCSRCVKSLRGIVSRQTWLVNAAFGSRAMPHYRLYQSGLSPIKWLPALDLGCICCWLVFFFLVFQVIAPSLLTVAVRYPYDRIWEYMTLGFLYYSIDLHLLFWSIKLSTANARIHPICRVLRYPAAIQSLLIAPFVRNLSLPRPEHPSLNALPDLNLDFPVSKTAIRNATTPG